MVKIDKSNKGWSIKPANITRQNVSGLQLG